MIFKSFSTSNMATATVLASVVQCYNNGMQPFVPAHRRKCNLDRTTMAQYLGNKVPTLLVAISYKVNTATSLRQFISYKSHIVMASRRVPKTRLPQRIVVVDGRGRTAPPSYQRLYKTNVTFGLTSNLITEHGPSSAGRKHTRERFLFA